MKKKYIPHTVKEGSRKHVISWIGMLKPNGKTEGFRKCSEPNCEINKEWDEVST